MYLHIGQDVVVLKKSIIGIFDLDNCTSSHITRKYLRLAEKEGKVINVCDDIPKSLVICQEENSEKLYLCQLNSATLLKRFENTYSELFDFKNEE